MKKYTGKIIAVAIVLALMIVIISIIAVLGGAVMKIFGFEYDSRLFSGRDIFSERAPLVVFANRSFITDVASYNKKTGEILYRTGEPVSEEYIEQMKDYVRLLHKHSAGIINNNYYHYFKEAIQEGS